MCTFYISALNINISEFQVGSTGDSDSHISEALIVAEIKFCELYGKKMSLLIWLRPG